MVEITFLRNPIHIISARRILYVLIVLSFSSLIQAQVNTNTKQGKKKIELIYADEDRIIVDRQTEKDIHHFTGNVQLKHNEIMMQCDSAHYSPDKNQVTAFSKIHIQQGDTTDLFGDYLFYDIYSPCC